MSTSSGSASASSSSTTTPTADELLQNLLDSVTPTASSSGSSGESSASSASSTETSASPEPASTPAASQATATPVPTSTSQSVASTADSKSSGGGADAGLSIGLAVAAVVVVAFVVLFFRQRKKRRYHAPGRHPHNSTDLGTPQLSIELPQPPPRLGDDPKSPGEHRISVFTSVQNGGESVFTTAGEVSPSFQSGARPAPSQYRVSNAPQTGPASTTFRMEEGSAAGFSAPHANPVPDSGKTNKLVRVVSGRVPSELEVLPPPAAAATPGSSLPRDTTSSMMSLNSLHDSTCGDLFKHGDGLGERVRAKSRAKHPSMVIEEENESTRSIAGYTAAAPPYRPAPPAEATPKTMATAPATPSTAPVAPANRRPPPPPPPAPALAMPPPVATSDTHVYRPSTESEISFKRLSTVSTDSLGSMKRFSTSSTDSANPRAGSMIEIVEIVGGDGSKGAKEIEI